MRKLLKILLLVIFPSLAFSQAAVHLNCVSNLQNGNVVLNWNNPSNPCPAGCFVAYNIFVSTNGGAYNLLTSINAATTVTYTQVGAGGGANVLLYYIQTECNCGGGVSYAYSDTVNNQPIPKPTINFITANGNGTTINWAPSTSIQTYAYIVYYYDPTLLQTFGIDTVYGYYNTTYTDLKHNPNKGSVILTVAAMDSCFTLGQYNTNYQNTVFAQVSEDRCNHAVTLTWNDYKNWQQGVKQYEVYESLNGAGFAKVQTLSAATNSFTFSNFKDKDILCFYIKARENILGDSSSSNQVCIGINVVQPPTYTLLQNATVMQNNGVQLTWVVDTNADLQAFNILRSNTNANYYFVQSANATNPPSTPLSSFDANAPVHQEALYYVIQSVDSCGKIFGGTHATTIFLSGDMSSTNSVHLKWNAFKIDSGTVHSYDILRSTDGGATFGFIRNVDSSTLDFYEGLDGFATTPDSFCYVVQAHFTFTNTKLQHSNISQSNYWCAHAYSEFFAPNTIFPKGKNNLFKPVILFPDILNYEMIIFNRNGEKIFTSQSYNTGWDGTFNGSEVPQGNYTYLITFQKPDGKKFVQQGNVMVVY